MTISEQIKYVLRKHPETKYDRGKFMWAYLEEFYGTKVYIMRQQFLDFWKSEATIERQLRDILKEDEFKQDSKSDSKRYEKAASFQIAWRPNGPKEKKRYEQAFGTKDYKDET